MHAIATFILGFIFGYLGQRSRLCFIGGMRDFVLIRDTYLIRGLFAFMISAFIGFLVFHFLSPSIKTFPWFINGKTVFLKKWASMNIKEEPHFMLPCPGDPISWSPKLLSHLLLAAIGGFGVGFLSVFAGGCPFRQHIMAAEGSLSAISYLFGFLSGAVLFHKFIAPIVKALL